MSRIGPFGTAPQLVDRKAGLIDMMVRDQPNVAAYQFYGARTLNAAYGAPTGSAMPGGAVTQASPLFTVGKRQQFRSTSIIKRRWSWYGETLRGMSRVAWDPTDYVSDPATDLPSDEEYWFVRVQESRPTIGSSAATGVVDLSGIIGLGDNLTIAGVLFTGTVGAGVPANQQFQADGGGAVAATALIATVNDAASQALLLAAVPVGVTVTASAGATADDVVLTASVTDGSGNLITLVPATGNIVVSGGTLTGGGDPFLTVSGPVDVGEPKLGPIYIVPRPVFFGQAIPTLMVQGTAPDGTGALAGFVPPLDLDMQVPNPMHIILPRMTSSITITNLDTTNTLLISTGHGDPMTAVGPTDGPAVVFGSFKDIVVAGDGGAVPFSIHAVVALQAGV